MQTLVDFLTKIAATIFNSKKLTLLIVAIAIFTLTILLIENSNSDLSQFFGIDVNNVDPGIVEEKNVDPGIVEEHKETIGLIALGSIALIVATVIMGIVEAVKKTFFV